jgi:hypothetical protein
VEAELVHAAREAVSDDAASALRGIRALQRDLPWWEERAVVLARQQRWSWARIARLLGRSRQAVWERYGRLHPPPLRRPEPSWLDRDRRRQAMTLADVLRQAAAAEDDQPVAW